MAAFTTANVGSLEDVVILSIVQEQLLSKAIVRPTVKDMSDKAGKGVKTIDVPNFSTAFGAPSVQNPDGETEVAFKTLDLAQDSINLDQWKNLPYRVADRLSIQNVVDLEGELAASAGQEMAIDLDQYVIAQLRSGASTQLDMDGANGTSLVEAITLVGINEARAVLKKANVTDLDGGMTILVSVEQEKNMLNIENFISAEKYGAREALLNGEIGKVYGMRVIVSNLLPDNESYIYHRSCMAFAAQKDVNFERQRSSVTLQAWEYSFSVGYGAAILDGGKRVVKMLGA